MPPGTAWWAHLDSNQGPSGYERNSNRDTNTRKYTTPIKNRHFEEKFMGLYGMSRDKNTDKTRTILKCREEVMLGKQI